MRSMLLSIAKSTSPLGWLARLSSFMVSNVFLLITFLALTNEDPSRRLGMAILGLLLFTIACSLLAWHKERLGGVLVLIGGMALGVTVFNAGRSFGIGAFSSLLALLYSLPFLAVGGLFLGAAGQKLKDV